MKLSIFDFDHTITKKHSFDKNQLTVEQYIVDCDLMYIRAVNKDTNDRIDAEFQVKARANKYIQQGVIDAKSQKKEGIKQHLCIDDEQMLAIITYHNNPDYVAGFVGAILGKKINSMGVSKIEQPGIAARFYNFNGVKNPLVICYISAAGDNYNNTLDQLYGKNEMLEFTLHMIQLELKPQFMTSISFYDDSLDNVVGTFAKAHINEKLGLCLNMKSLSQQDRVEEYSVMFKPYWVNPCSENFQEQLVTRYISECLANQILPLKMDRAAAESSLNQKVNSAIIRTSSYQGYQAITLHDENNSIIHHLMDQVVELWLILTAQSKVNITSNGALSKQFLDCFSKIFPWINDVLFDKKEPLHGSCLLSMNNLFGQQQQQQQQQPASLRSICMFQSSVSHEEESECDPDYEKSCGYQ